jgi:transcriptional regulator with XRE-family HTH domain
MTVEELGRKSGVSPHTLHKLEQGCRQQARTNTMQQLAEALSVPVNYLVVGAETVADFAPEELLMAVKYRRLSTEHRKVLNMIADELLRLPQTQEAFP